MAATREHSRAGLALSPASRKNAGDNLVDQRLMKEGPRCVTQ